MPASCIDCAASVTDLRLEPNMFAKNSCVYGRCVPSARSCIIRSRRHTLFRCMQGIARDSLLNLRQQRLRTADEEIAHVFTALEFRLQQFDRAANYATFQLHKASIKGDATVHGRKEAESSLAPYVCGLNCRAILQNGQQRQDSALREIGVLEETASLADQVTKLELDRLKMRVDPLAASGLQGAEQLIAPRITCDLGPIISSKIG
jgi:hypothetical protein